MQQTLGQRSGAWPAVVGLVLVAVGAVTLFFRQLGVDVLPAMGSWGWPFFVIVPGLVLLGAALAPVPPKGLGFAIAGSIVTAIGILLLYQSSTGHWESWAYAWAVIPMAAGIGSFLYGALTRTSGLITGGLWLAAIGAILLIVGAWFFEGIFAGEERFAESGNWWPVAAVAIGAVILFASFVRPRLTVSPPPANAATPATPAPDSLTDGGPKPL